MMEVVVTNGLLELQDVHSSSQIITTNKPTPNFLQAGCPSCHPTVSKHWRENITFHGLAYPRAHLGIFQLCLWPL